MKNVMFVFLCCTIAIVLVAGCTQSQQVPVTTPAMTPVAALPATPQATLVSTMMTPAPSTMGDTVRTGSSSLGTILTDAQGMTLYFFTRDIPGNGKSTCYGQCEVFWPIFLTETATVSPPLVAGDFSVITRDDGTRQSTYKGWPLYYYLTDKQPGDITGEAVTGNWFVAKPDYTVMLSQQPATGDFLTDSTGRTLYFFSRDEPLATSCTDACLTNWPAFSSGQLIAPSSLVASDFAGGRRPDGVLQSFYKSRPLYYFVKDTKPGDMNGQGVNNVWFVANMSGYVPPTPAPVPTTPTPAPTPTIDYGTNGGGGGGGY